MNLAFGEEDPVEIRRIRDDPADHLIDQTRLGHFKHEADISRLNAKEFLALLRKVRCCFVGPQARLARFRLSMHRIRQHVLQCQRAIRAHLARRNCALAVVQLYCCRHSVEEGLDLDVDVQMRVIAGMYLTWLEQLRKKYHRGTKATKKMAALAEWERKMGRRRNTIISFGGPPTTLHRGAWHFVTAATSEIGFKTFDLAYTEVLRGHQRHDNHCAVHSLMEAQGQAMAAIPPMPPHELQALNSHLQALFLQTQQAFEIRQFQSNTLVCARNKVTKNRPAADPAIPKDIIERFNSVDGHSAYLSALALFDTEFLLKNRWVRRRNIRGRIEAVCAAPWTTRNTAPIPLPELLLGEINQQTPTPQLLQQQQQQQQLGLPPRPASANQRRGSTCSSTTPRLDRSSRPPSATSQRSTDDEDSTNKLQGIPTYHWPGPTRGVRFHHYDRVRFHRAAGFDSCMHRLANFYLGEIAAKVIEAATRNDEYQQMFQPKDKDKESSEKKKPGYLSHEPPPRGKSFEEEEMEKQILWATDEVVKMLRGGLKKFFPVLISSEEAIIVDKKSKAIAGGLKGGKGLLQSKAAEDAQERARKEAKAKLFGVGKTISRYRNQLEDLEETTYVPPPAPPMDPRAVAWRKAMEDLEAKKKEAAAEEERRRQTDPFFHLRVYVEPRSVLKDMAMEKLQAQQAKEARKKHEQMLKAMEREAQIEAEVAKIARGANRAEEEEGGEPSTHTPHSGSPSPRQAQTKRVEYEEDTRFPPRRAGSPPPLLRRKKSPPKRLSAFGPVDDPKAHHSVLLNPLKYADVAFTEGMMMSSMDCIHNTKSITALQESSTGSQRLRLPKGLLDKRIARVFDGTVTLNEVVAIGKDRRFEELAKKQKAAGQVSPRRMQVRRLPARAPTPQAVDSMRRVSESRTALLENEIQEVVKDIDNMLAEATDPLQGLCDIAEKVRHSHGPRTTALMTPEKASQEIFAVMKRQVQQPSPGARGSVLSRIAETAIAAAGAIERENYLSETFLFETGDSLFMSLQNDARKEQPKPSVVLTNNQKAKKSEHHHSGSFLWSLRREQQRQSQTRRHNESKSERQHHEGIGSSTAAITSFPASSLDLSVDSAAAMSTSFHPPRKISSVTARLEGATCEIKNEVSLRNHWKEAQEVLFQKKLLQPPPLVLSTENTSPFLHNQTQPPTQFDAELAHSPEVQTSTRNGKELIAPSAIEVEMLKEYFNRHEKRQTAQTRLRLQF